jgi:hypothetical protein
MFGEMHFATLFLSSSAIVALAEAYCYTRVTEFKSIGVITFHLPVTPN